MQMRIKVRSIVTVLLLLTSVFAPLDVRADLTTGLVAYYPFTGNSNDSMGSNNGTDTSVVYGTSYGKINQGASFNGSSSYIIKSNPTGLPSGNSDITIYAWVYMTANQSGQFPSIAAFGVESQNRMAGLLINSPGTNGLYWGGYANDVSVYWPYSTNTWYMVSAVYTATTRNVKFYVNGSSIGSSTLPYTPNVGADFLNIGVQRPGLKVFFKGYIDEVGIWKRSLSDLEISSLYNNGAGLALISTNGACGAANGTTVTITPTANLCTTGTASAVTGTGPWNWTCAGSNGGTTATCSANVQSSTPTPPSITWRHQGDGKVSGITTDGSSITGGAQFYQETNQAWSIVGQGDFDGDGVKDLAWWNSSTGQVYLMLMSSPTTVKSGTAIYTEPNTNWRIVATGDINGDGMQISGTTVTQGGIIYTEPDTDWKIVAAADFNGNGRAELLWWNTVAGKVAIGQTNGTNASTATVIWLEPDTSWRIAGAGDLDGDGKADIVWHNRTTGQVYGMQTNGSSVTNGAMMYTEPNTLWEIVSVGNYNSDNKAELLWWNQQTGQVSLLQMNGLSVSGVVSLYTEPDTTWHIQGETEWRDNLYGRGVTTTTK
ncbi:MAG: FG-GAP-like repeat-containing protein [Desulfuromonadales bacterium]